ncbi:MAG TPA: TonB-dependent receptor, partial [Bryobacteraceae bacterium]|nr:TonB-dependent receptor [Bryobacteraceae bacterium]
GSMLNRVALILFCAGIAFAQDFRATLSGIITDPSGAAIPTATVKAIKEGTNETKETQTNARGIYNIPFLDPGEYMVVASAQGFRELRRTGIVLRVADKVNLPLTLEVGDVATSIEVNATAELISTQTAARGLVFDPIKVQEYPLNGRQSYMLMMLTPGVLFTQQQFGSSGFSGTRAWDVNGSYTINGGRTGTNQFLLNGAPISTDGTWQIAPNVEAIQEFKVMTNTYDAEYGRSGGGHVNTTIRSGTNQWHGTVFDFWRNTVLDANATQNNQQGAPRGKRNQHQFGGTIGFPIRKDKDFLFFSFEGWREIVPFPVVSNTIPAEMRNGGGFTEYNVRIYDPLTSRLCTAGEYVPCLSGGQYLRTPFPGNVIPANRISPIGKRMVDLYPLPNQVGARTLQQNFFATGEVGRYRYEQPMFRYDKVVGDKDRLYGLFYFEDGSEYRNSSGFPPPAQTGNMPGTHRTKHGVVVDWTRMISPTSVVDLRGSWTRFWQNFPDVSDRSFTVQNLGIRNLPVPPNAVTKTPRVELDSYQTILGGRILNWSSRDQISFQPTLSQTRGRHQLKYGGELARIQRGTRDEGRAAGQLSFNRYWTQQWSGRGLGALDGYPVATMLLGLPTGGHIDFNDTYLRNEPYAAMFVQDDWKVTNQLTLNLGLRYDIQWPLTELHDRVIAGFDFNGKNPLSDRVLARWRELKAQYDAANPNAVPYPTPPSELRGGLLFAGKNGQPRRTYDFDLTNIQPRAGFAWQFLNKTVMRGGFGVFHRTATQGNLSTGFNQSTNYQRSVDGDRTPSACGSGNCTTGPYSLDNPFPNGLIPPTGSSLGLLTNVGRDANFDGRQRLIPRTYQWSVGFERELPWAMVIEASYVGSRTVHEPMTIQLDDMSFENFQRAQADPNEYNRPLPNPFAGILPETTGRGSSPLLNRRDFLRRLPLFTGVQMYTNPWGGVKYDALQIRFEKRAFADRASGAVTWVVSYTFAKQLERSLRNENAFEFQPLIWQLTDIDRPQQLSVSGVWDLPFGKRRHYKIENPVLNGIFGDWNANWVFTYYEGIPTGKPDAVYSCGDYRVADQTRNRWFNNDKSCYIQRAPYTFREVESRFSNIRNPAYGPQVNVALAKKFRFGETAEFELRGESFNVTNTPILSGPNTSFTDPRFGQLPIQQL